MQQEGNTKRLRTLMRAGNHEGKHGNNFTLSSNEGFLDAGKRVNEDERQVRQGGTLSRDKRRENKHYYKINTTK